MKTYKILGHKLTHHDSEFLTKGIEKYPYLNLETLPQLEDGNIGEDVIGFFLYIDESMTLEKLEQFLKKYQHRSINIILKNKNFDFLMMCYRYNATSVFEEKLNQPYLNRTLVQIDLMLNKDSDNFPLRPVIDLFAAPVKIKTDQEMHERLSHYFHQFEAVKFFDVLRIDGEGRSLVSGAEVSTELEKIEIPNVPEDYIGFEHDTKVEEAQVIFTPLLNTHDRSLWLVLEVSQEKRSFVLNHLFYKFLENVHIYRMNKEKEHELTALATTDDVTGLYNQRKLSQDLASAVDYHEKESKNFSIMFIDVDHFKNVNDSYGHVVGSKLLQDIGEVLSHLLRASDDIYRYGGDEFVVIMPSVNIQTVHEIATRILSKIKSKKFDIGDGTDFHLSVSIGIAEYPTDATSAIEIIRFADEMMYQSKKSGRGKVFHIKEVQNVNVGAQ